MVDAGVTVPLPDGLRDHVVILNVNEKVRRVVEEIVLGNGPRDIVLVVQDHQLWQSNPDWHPRPQVDADLHVHHGCPSEPDDLEAVNIDRARAAVILADPRQGDLADAHSTLVAVAIERRCPQVHTVMELISSVNRVHLRSTEVNEVVCLGELTERLIAQSCVSPGITDVIAHLLNAHPGTTQTFVVDLPEALAGATYREVARRAIQAQAPFIVCGFARAGSMVDNRGGATPRQSFVLNPRAGAEPGKDTVLAAADRLVVIAYERPDLGRLVGG